MEYFRKIFALIICSVITYGCVVEEKDLEVKVNDGVYLSFLGELEGENTKIYWEDINKKGSTSAKWERTVDYNANLISCVYNGQNFVAWNNGNYYSLNTVTPFEKDAKMADIVSLSKIGVNGINVGNKIFSFAPIGNQIDTNFTVVEANKNAVNVKIQMPNVFTQKQSGNMMAFKKYSYVYAVANVVENDLVGDNNGKYVKISKSVYKPIPAALRINVKNNNLEGYVVKNISLIAYKNNSISGRLEEAKVFPNRLNLNYRGGDNVSISENGNKDEYFSKIVTNVLDENELSNGQVGSYYTFLLPCDNKNAMEGVSLKFVVVATNKNDGKDYSFAIDKGLEKIDVITKEKRFKGGYIYTVDLELNKNNIEKHYYKNGEYRVYMTSSKPKPIKIIITGDGYLEKDFMYGGKFDKNADEGIEELFSIEPYKTYREYFSVYKLAFYSNQEGVSYGNGLKVDTYFNTTIAVFGGAAMTCNYDKVFSNVATAMADKTVNKEAVIVTDKDYEVSGCIVLVNKNVYAGTCYRKSIVDKKFIAMVPISREYNINKRFGNVLIHEYGGHGIGKFADEYFIGDNSRLDEYTRQNFNQHRLGIYLNVHVNNDSTSVPWKDLLGRKGYEHVGIFEGAFNKQYGIYRSENFSCMRDNRKYFNSQCRKVIVTKIKEAAGETFDIEDFIKNDVQKTDNTVRN